MKEPLVSIIVPVYNASHYLPKCLDSILDQTYANIELICVNDGSKDDSLRVLRDYIARDERMKLINIDNHGVAYARNIAMQQAKGVFFLFVDADDWIEPNCVATLFHFCEIHHCEIVMYPYMRERTGITLKRTLFDSSRVFKGKECKQLARRMIGPIGKEIVNPVSLDSYGTVWGKMYHRSIVEGLEFIDLSVIGTAEDSLFNMQAFKRASTIGYCQDVNYHYRRNNETSLTNGSIPGLKEKWHTAFDIIAKNHRDKDERLALTNRIALSSVGLLINAYNSDEPYDQIKDVLSDDIIQGALAELLTKYLPCKWKCFFYLVKHKNASLLRIILLIIQTIRRF